MKAYSVTLTIEDEQSRLTERQLTLDATDENHAAELLVAYLRDHVRDGIRSVTIPKLLYETPPPYKAEN